MSHEDFIITLFCKVDEAMAAVRKHPQLMGKYKTCYRHILSSGFVYAF